jgi:hypothetical protein
MAAFGKVTKTFLLWSMLISGIVLATRQARADTGLMYKVSTPVRTLQF